MTHRRLMVVTTLVATLGAGCGTRPGPEIQTALDRGGLSSGDHVWAQQIAAHAVRRQHIRPTGAWALAQYKTSRHELPHSGSCPKGPLTLLVLAGSFPMQGLSVRAEEIYVREAATHLSICSRAYLDSMPVLPKNHESLDVPGTASHGD